MEYRERTVTMTTRVATFSAEEVIEKLRGTLAYSDDGTMRQVPKGADLALVVTEEGAVACEASWEEVQEREPFRLTAPSLEGVRNDTDREVLAILRSAGEAEGLTPREVVQRMRGARQDPQRARRQVRDSLRALSRAGLASTSGTRREARSGPASKTWCAA